MLSLQRILGHSLQHKHNQMIVENTIHFFPTKIWHLFIFFHLEQFFFKSDYYKGLKVSILLARNVK